MIREDEPLRWVNIPQDGDSKASEEKLEPLALRPPDSQLFFFFFSLPRHHDFLFRSFVGHFVSSGALGLAPKLLQSRLGKGRTGSRNFTKSL